MHETGGRDHGSNVVLYIHLIWTTRQRRPLITSDAQRRMYACIQAECHSMNVEVVALNGTDDHVHLLARIPSTVNVATVAKQVKGASSHLMTHAMGHDGFRWQEGYSAFTVSRWDTPKLVQYIDRQEEHHRLETVKPSLEPESH